jgi:uncharacterized membrane protein
MNKKVKTALGYFVKGLLTLLPLLLTAYLFTIVFSFIKTTAIDWIVVFIPQQYRSEIQVVVVAEIATAFGLFCALCLLGIMAETLLGKRTVRLLERLANAIPLVNIIYRTIRQTVDLIRLRKTMGTMNAVLAEYPSSGLWMIGFITGHWEERLTPASVRNHVTVFIPTSPNPTGGFLAILPLEKIWPLDIPTETVLKMVLTGGMVKK